MFQASCNIKNRNISASKNAKIVLKNVLKSIRNPILSIRIWKFSDHLLLELYCIERYSFFTKNSLIFSKKSWYHLCFLYFLFNIRAAKLGLDLFTIGWPENYKIVLFRYFYYVKQAQNNDFMIVFFPHNHGNQIILIKTVNILLDHIICSHTLILWQIIFNSRPTPRF